MGIGERRSSTTVVSRESCGENVKRPVRNCSRCGATGEGDRGKSGLQWRLLEPLLPPDSPMGHPRAADLREVVNDILYVLRGGIPWRLMPHDLSPWGTVWWYFRKWRADGTWERVEEALRPMVREQEGRDATPSGAIIDSQSVGPRKKGASRL